MILEYCCEDEAIMNPTCGKHPRYSSTDKKVVFRYARYTFLYKTK